MLAIRALSRSFREGGRQHRVLAGLDADFARGETIAIMGRSGSGKSTLLNLICGIDRPDAGTIDIDGERVTALPERQRTLFRRRHLGFVYQFFNLIPTLDVEENVRLPLELNGIRGVEARRRSRAMLDQVGLGDRTQSAPDALSGGEQQRVAIARALVHGPSLVLADEPTGNLDDPTAESVMNLLDALVTASGGTLLIATHARSVASRADRVFELAEGRLQAAR
ncbi:MAG TPA: ABC transporter ATP-binding protein [Steroidobacteraceae bacterium]|nr:ABC transporter ATP-binding protein [Steroidobacteraceae bacterium]